ncbi:MAG: hypothetical protein LBN06_08045 [Prevotellaceae bacterium]|jgi:hypothetical protein|nr:hypothetical protein [Prevotellaceae bacterium]
MKIFHSKKRVKNFLLPFLFLFPFYAYAQQGDPVVQKFFQEKYAEEAREEAAEAARKLQKQYEENERKSSGRSNRRRKNSSSDAAIERFKQQQAEKSKEYRVNKTNRNLATDKKNVKNSLKGNRISVSAFKDIKEVKNDNNTSEQIHKGESQNEMGLSSTVRSNAKASYLQKVRSTLRHLPTGGKAIIQVVPQSKSTTEEDAIIADIRRSGDRAIDAIVEPLLKRVRTSFMKMIKGRWLTSSVLNVFEKAKEHSDTKKMYSEWVNRIFKNFETQSLNLVNGGKVYDHLPTIEKESTRDIDDRIDAHSPNKTGKFVRKGKEATEKGSVEIYKRFTKQ